MLLGKALAPKLIEIQSWDWSETKDFWKIFKIVSTKNSSNDFGNLFSKMKQGHIHGHTSCGRLGRGGNARFHTFELMHTNGLTDKQKDKGSYRVACPQLKIDKS